MVNKISYKTITYIGSKSVCCVLLYFYNTAFSLINSHILTTTVNISANTTNGESNPNICENILDKVFLPSYKDYKNQAYGFSYADGHHQSRYYKTTDWT